MKAYVVDDMEDNRALLSKILKGEGYEVETFGDGREFVTAIKRHGIDSKHVVFVDLKIPGMDGISVARQLRAMGFLGVIIAITATKTAALKTEGLFDKVLGKPIRTNLLQQIDFEALRKVRASN